jgi:Family of unknown function (DUF5518)
LPWGFPGLGESVATGVWLLIAVVFCVSIGFWMAFADEGEKNSKKGLLVVGLIWGSVAFFFLAFGQLWGSGVGPLNSGPLIMGTFLFAITLILGVAAILAVMLILDEYFGEADVKDEMDKRRLPTEDSSLTGEDARKRPGFGMRSVWLGAFVGFIIAVAVYWLQGFSPQGGFIGGFIGGLVAGLIAGGVSKGTRTGLLAGIFGGFIIAILATIGFIAGGTFQSGTNGGIVFTIFVIIAIASMVGGFIGGLLSTFEH